MTDMSQTVLFHPQTSAPCGQCRIFLLYDPAMAVPSGMERPQSVLSQNGRCVGSVLPRGLRNKLSKVRCCVVETVWSIFKFQRGSFTVRLCLSECKYPGAKPKLGISRACFPMLKIEQTELLEEEKNTLSQGLTQVMPW